MIQNPVVPQSAILTNIVRVVTQLKWAWDYLLYQSFFVQSPGIILPEYADDLSVMFYENYTNSGDSIDCFVCLCKIDEGDEIRELRCDHLFHIVCLDRSHDVPSLPGKFKAVAISGGAPPGTDCY
ncbi:unnamed protein product [Fraxinus pennsylvanica]|uniref:RING-type domain-containing protein n=1 Tax=Fraxinus pennsylvanica TaxID=56036 RepID=A0AAD2A659_9LAMI|nr:unnamed protein product [Fraxinus pennsylvanica]